MISGHNNHIMQCEDAGTPVLGSLLAEELVSGYFAIGTEFPWGHWVSPTAF